jgi:LysM repeat protein
MEAYQENKFKLAESVAKILFNYANGLSSMANVIQYTTHEVKSGDTLGTIATIYGITIERIMEDNDIDNPNIIHVGQKLKIYKS